MTIKGLSFESSYCSLGRTGNDDYQEFTIIKTKTIGSYVLVHVNFPDRIINNDKIVLIKGMNSEEVMNIKELDPHFQEFNNVIDPYPHIVARFYPSNEGWDMGIKMMMVLKNTEFVAQLVEQRSLTP